MLTEPFYWQFVGRPLWLYDHHSDRAAHVELLHRCGLVRLVAFAHSEGWRPAHRRATDAGAYPLSAHGELAPDPEPTRLNLRR